jgi:hypothetical protein
VALPRTVVWEPSEPGLRGHDLVRLAREGDGYRADGGVVAVEQGTAWSVRFAVVCDAAWRTRRAEVWAVAPDAVRRLLLEADGAGGWRVDGAAAPALAGCLDVDLAATPFTNTLPIRRLALAVGQRGVARAVWVGAPRLELEVLEQSYERVGVDRYRYEVPASGFGAEVLVDDQGLVVEYAGLARRVAAF